MTSNTRGTGYLFWVLCAVGLFAILSSTMSKNPVLNPFARALGTPDSLMGFVAAASTIPGILVSLPAGSLSDIFGRRRILLLSTAVFASAPFFYLLVGVWWQLALVRFYHGFATAIFVPVANAFVVELYPYKRAERTSLFSSMTVVGRTLAPFLGGYILFITDYGFHELYLAVGLAGSAALVVAAMLLRATPESRKTPRGGSSRLLEGWAAVAGKPSIMVVGLVEAAQYYAFGATEFFLVGYLREIARFDSFSYGAILGSQLAVIPLLKPLMGKFSDKVGRKIPIVVGSALSALALTAVPFTTQFMWLLLISVLYGIGFSMVTSSTPALVSELTEERFVGTGMGFLGTVMDVGQTMGPIITGLILATGPGYVGSFSALAALLLIVSLVFIIANFARSQGYRHGR